ncbi:helix-turn-helix domain-containing protein [Wenjunlia tyrosinilytica]|jgi:hypothetical protein|uniref:Uncharacterized protein n=1 Tax=Wenjunlia tyrosinilytica TaxID=1544741 RepID=A0A917ZWJ3_9ACTN|nr:helix-turn-helix domain-containing protein [Wenjunlia tyrosinilytica]GGO98009.1 hypothetical protein GCM10012280_61140 [Wenjunlia tyrosinilytica]
MTEPSIEEIRRLHQEEGLSVNIVARRLGVSKATVRRALHDELPRTLPQEISRESLLAMDDKDFSQLVRDNLLPREEEGPQRRAWDVLWHTLNVHNDLSERTFDLLEEHLEEVEDALEQESLEERELKRLKKLKLNLDMAWDRLERTERERREVYQGHDREAVRERMREFNAPARRVVAALVRAIGDHERATAEQAAAVRPQDSNLWDVVDELNLGMLLPGRPRD